MLSPLTVLQYDACWVWLYFYLFLYITDYSYLYFSACLKECFARATREKGSASKGDSEICSWGYICVWIVHKSSWLCRGTVTLYTRHSWCKNVVCWQLLACIWICVMLWICFVLSWLIYWYAIWFDSLSSFDINHNTFDYTLRHYLNIVIIFQGTRSYLLNVTVEWELI